MPKIDYIRLDRADHPEWDQVEALFLKMYSAMVAMDLMVPLAENGSGKWLKVAKNTAGKFGIVILAKNNDKAVGFAHGMIKFLPDYLGGFPVGMITHVYVNEEARRSGTGKEMVHNLEEWFNLKNVHSIELQVISGNPSAREFWEKLGYKEELLQYRKMSPR